MMNTPSNEELIEFWKASERKRIRQKHTNRISGKPTLIAVAVTILGLIFTGFVMAFTSQYLEKNNMDGLAPIIISSFVVFLSVLVWYAPFSMYLAKNSMYLAKKRQECDDRATEEIIRRNLN